jgi:hypothetical protein
MPPGCARLSVTECTNGILAKEQYGFRSDSSAENIAYDIINEIIKL